MAQALNFPFHLLNSDEFFDIVRQNPATTEDFQDFSRFEDFISATANIAPDLVCNHDDSIHRPSCHYLTENQFKEQDFKSEKFMLLHSNIRSINRNFDNLKYLIENYQNNCAAIALTETWLTEHSNNDLYALPDFDLIVNNRTERVGGGVGIYLPKKYDYLVHERLNCMNNVVESLFIELINLNGKNICLSSEL